MHQGEEAQMHSFILGERLRDAGLDVVLHCASANGVGSFKAQIKKADASGATFATIIGEDEAKKGMVTIKSLRSSDTENQQVSVPFTTVVDYLVDQILDAGEAEVHCDNPNHTHH